MKIKLTTHVNYSLDEKYKFTEMIVKHDEEKLGITRTLQHKLDEKVAKITKYEQYLKDLEQNSGKMQRNLEKDFKNDIGDLNYKHDR